MPPREAPQTDLDPSIIRARESEPAGWNDERALRAVELMVDQLGVNVDYEPPAEQWVRFGHIELGGGMISVRLPLAIVWPADARLLSEIGNNIVVVRVSAFDTEELRASPDLLRSTLLPHWCADLDTEAFSANDLFVESI